MGSPFPGMDPYLERHWGDVHTSLAVYIRDTLQPLLPPGLKARAEEKVYLNVSEDERRLVSPDVHVFEKHVRPNSSLESGVLATEPIILHLDLDDYTQRHVEIVDFSSGKHVVTVIEILSPTNKHGGESRKQYLQKQSEILDSGANLVEIDLIRHGQWTLSVPSSKVPFPRRTPYCVMVRRASALFDAEYYAIPIQKVLPTIRVPLRPTDADVMLNLQPVMDRAFFNGRYDDEIDYAIDPVPPLSAEDAIWADALLRKAGKR